MISSLVNRTRIGSAIDKGLAESLKKLSEETRIPQSRLLDEAIELLLEKHGKSITETVIEPVVEPTTKTIVEDELDPLDEPIELLGLPAKIYYAIKKSWVSDVDTIRNLIDVKDTILPKTRGIGPTSIEVINEALDEYLEKHRR